jgi:hypothetical protein
LPLLFAFATKDVAVTVAVSVCSTGSRRVSVIVLVALTTDVVGEPVNSVIVLVRVLVTKTVEAPGMAALLKVSHCQQKKGIHTYGVDSGCVQFPPAQSITATGQQSGCPASERQQVKPSGQL